MQPPTPEEVELYHKQLAEARRFYGTDEVYILDAGDRELNAEDHPPQEPGTTPGTTPATDYEPMTPLGQAALRAALDAGAKPSGPAPPASGQRP